MITKVYPLECPWTIINYSHENSVSTVSVYQNEAYFDFALIRYPPCVSLHRKKEELSYPNTSVISLDQGRHLWAIHQLDQLEVWCHHSQEFPPSNKEWDHQSHLMVITNWAVLEAHEMYFNCGIKWHILIAVLLNVDVTSFFQILLFRSVWCSSPGHARVSSWCNASIWSRAPNGASLSRWTS